MRLMPKKFGKTPLSKIQPDQRVITRKGGVLVNGKHVCRGCKEERFIMNPTYHLCSTCAGHHQYFGHRCEICAFVSDGTIRMDWDNEYSLIRCFNCSHKMRKYSLSPEILSEFLSIEKCSLCDCDLTDDKSNTGRVIDHDHNCCSGEMAHTGNQKICGKCVRGVICSSCNKAEGHAPADVIEWSKRVKEWRKVSRR